MNEEWGKIFNYSQQLYFGDLYDSNMLNTYYFEDKNLEANRHIILNYIEDAIDYSPILVGGDAGVGKSTFINNLVSKYLPVECYFNVILNVDNQPNNPSIKEYLIRQLNKYCSLLLGGEIIGHRIISKYKKEYDKYISNEMFYTTKEERISDIINLLSSILKHLIAKKQPFPKLVVFLDQVEKFGSDTLISYISEYLTFSKSLIYIKFILCARKETIKVAKQSVKGFYSTYFKRFIEIESPPIERILQKRFYSKQNYSITIETINTYFTRTFCDLIEDISNNNIRIMLRIFEKIIETAKPYHGRDGYVHYFSFLIKNGYIDDLYKTINQADTIPLIKIVFDALHYYATVDDKFYQTIMTKVMTIKSVKSIVGLTRENVKIAVKYLLDNDFVIDSFDVNNNFSFTKKGEAYSKFVETDAYSRIFIKDINNDRFKRNIFTDQDFSKINKNQNKTKHEVNVK